MKGEGRPPESAGPSRDDTPADPARSSFTSVDLEDIEAVPASVEEIDVDFDDDFNSVDKLLSMTGEHLSIDEQRESLKEAGRTHPDRGSAPADAKPSISLPTPYELGAAAPPLARSLPPPLPAAGGPSRRSTSSVPPGPAHGELAGPFGRPPLPGGLSTATARGHAGRGAESPSADKVPSQASATASSTSRRPPPLPRSDERSTNSRDSNESSAAHARRVRSGSHEGARLVELLSARIERIESSDDTIGLARAYVELAVVHETLADDGRVNDAAEAALRASPDMAAAHAILRRRLHSRAHLSTALHHLERELEVASTETSATELVAEKARMLEACDRPDEAREAWELALGRSPRHAAALKGLEGNLVRRAYAEGADPKAWDDLALHLGRMSDAYAAEPALAAWLHVERARILELRLGRIDSARGAYERALRLDPGVGKVRDACTLHAAAHQDSARLAALLADEARIEPTSKRCARLELDAAGLSHAVLGDDARAIELLERAAARAPTAASVDLRVLDELVRRYEASAQPAEAARARRARLRHFSEPSAVVYELRRLSSIEERLGNMEAAIGDLERALSFENDPLLVEELDRLLCAAGKNDERVVLWHDQAQRAIDNTTRARALERAAKLAEDLGRYDEARSHLRAAWVAAPGDSAVLDVLSRLTSPAPTETFDREVRSLIELYAQAAQATDDGGRRIAYLEKIATLWEDLVGDPMRAARTYDEILRLEPTRRGAILGLERTAGRIGDDLALSKALMLDASLAEGNAALTLRVRAAEVLARVDPARASAVVRSVVEADPKHHAGRQLETRLHEEAGRWEQAALSLRARIDMAASESDRAALWISLAHIQDARLNSPRDAVTSLVEGRKADPVHPVPPDEIARVLEATGDARALRAAIEQLALDSITPQERAHYLTRAAEIDELRLDDDVSATSLYMRALAETPEDERVADRLLRVLARRTVTVSAPEGAYAFDSDAWQALTSQLARSAEVATTADQARSYSFHLASLLVAANDDLPRAARILDGILEADPSDVGALRLLEAIARRGEAQPALARVLKLQGEHLQDVRARVGALWNLASVETWQTPSGESVATYTRIVELDPTDPSGLEAAARLALRAARTDSSARRAAIAALRSLVTMAEDDGVRLATELRLALLLDVQASEATSDESSAAASREALTRLRDANALDPLSVTAATSLARVANRLGDAAGAVAAAVSLADLAVQPEVRARYLVSAANLLLSDAPDEALGAAPDRIERAAQLLEKALDADADSTNAATRLSQVRASQDLGERLVDVFRPALRAATLPEAVVFLGSEIARVARDDIGDLGVAIEAMRRVREAAPDHVPSLLTLAELLIAQRAWPEAVETLEDVVGRAPSTGPRMTALFALASVYEKVLSRNDDAEAALRRALAIEEKDPRAIRALLHRLAAKQSEMDEFGSPRDKMPLMIEIASLLERLAAAETDAHAKCDVLLELADIRVALKDPGQATKSLVEAVATAPEHPRAFARLARLFRSADAPGGLDAVAYARALGAVIERGQQLGTSDPRWFSVLGNVEVTRLNRLRDGATHLARAVEMDPSRHESRLELANAYFRLGAVDEAAQTVMSLLTPTSRPLMSISDPAKALELLEQSLIAERRPDEALVVSELRAIAGALPDSRQAWLRSRRLGAFEAHHVPLDRATLVRHVVPPEGRQVLLDVALAIAGIESKLFRANLKELGITSKDRVSRRSGSPTRALLDRLAKALGIADVELVISTSVSRPRVLVQDVAWVVVPKTLTDLPEPTQLASMGRALARVALNVPWLEELPPPHIAALLHAAARSVSASFGNDTLDASTLKLANEYEPSFAKELSRKQRQSLEKLVPAMSAPDGSPRGIEVLIGALARAELRIAYLLTGDVLATVDELRGLDAELLHATEAASHSSVGAVLDHPFAGDVVRYALTEEATALRRRVGSVARALKARRWIEMR